MQVRLEMLDELMVVGIAIRTNTAQEMNPEIAQTPLLYQRFIAENIAEQLSGHIIGKSIVVGVLTDYESDFAGDFTKILGCRVHRFENIPNDMTSMIIPAGQYLVFSNEGQLPNVLDETWQAVWKHCAEGKYPAPAYTADFEIYDLDRLDTISIYLSTNN